MAGSKIKIVVKRECAIEKEYVSESEAVVEQEAAFLSLSFNSDVACAGSAAAAAAFTHGNQQQEKNLFMLTCKKVERI